MSLSVEVNEAGFMRNPSEWSEDVMRELAESQNIELNEEVIGYVRLAREMYENDGVVPPIRIFAKAIGDDRKGTKLNGIFNGGVMKKIALIGGLPQPTGCV